MLQRLELATSEDSPPPANQLALSACAPTTPRGRGGWMWIATTADPGACSRAEALQALPAGCQELTRGKRVE
jgi:hypothetical protein